MLILCQISRTFSKHKIKYYVLKHWLHMFLRYWALASVFLCMVGSFIQWFKWINTKKKTIYIIMWHVLQLHLSAVVESNKEMSKITHLRYFWWIFFTFIWLYFIAVSVSPFSTPLYLWFWAKVKIKWSQQGCKHLFPRHLLI